MDSLEMMSMLTLGLLGTGHCIGMCGPLVFAFPGQTGRFTAHLAYHLGRLTTYVIIGAILGGLGAGIVRIAGEAGADPMVWIARIQAGVSLFAAVFLLSFGFMRMGFFPEPEWLYSASPSRIPGGHSAISAAASGGSLIRMLWVGLFMGMLPCGLSFAAFARALPAGGPLQGAVLVAFFGLGTLPGLLLVGTGAGKLFRRYRRHSDILSGMIMIGMAVSLAADVILAVTG